MPSPDIVTARVNGVFWAPNDVPSHSWTSSQSRLNGTHRDSTGEASSSARSVADMDNMDNGYDSGSLTPRQREKSAVRSIKPLAATVAAPVKLSPDLDCKGGTAEANWYHEISTEFTDMCAVMVDALQQFCPSQILEPAREQFSASSVSVPAPTLSALHCALKNVSFIAQNLTTFTSRHLRGIGDARETFDIGDLLQGVGDMLSGLAAKRKVELVIYHGDDNLHEQGQQAVKAVDFQPIYVRGNERCLTYALAHIVRQVLMIAQPGDSIELGLFMFPQHRPDLEELQAESGFDERPQVFGLPARCIIDIAHKFTGRDTRHAPNLETTLLQRLLGTADAELTMDSLFRPQCAAGRACELSFTLETSQPPVAEASPSFVHGIGDQPLMSHEPTFEQLADFGHELKDKKFSVTVYTKELSTEPLLASLSSWGVDLAVVGNGESAHEYLPEKPSKGGRPFVFIDDDIEILKSQIQATNVPTKRPAIHRVQSSSSHVTPRQNSNSHPMITIVYFTSLDNFKLIREVVRAAVPFSMYPEVVVVPKPIGPRRLLTILYMALNRPRVDPSFSPIATSPSAPAPNVPNGALLTPSVSGDISKPGSPRPIGPRSNSGRSVGSSTKENLPVTPASPATEYFPAKFTDNNPLTGIRIQDSDGAVQGIYFNPKGKSTPSSPAGVVGIPLADTFASMQALASFLPVESDPVSLESPLERIYHSRRTSTPQGSTAAPRLGPEHNVVPPIKVLVVDDNRINREICGKALRKIGVASDLAVNGQDALNKWRTGEFHMILMDIQMPVMGGLEATKQIRHEEKMMALAGLPHGTPVAEGSAPGFTPPVRTPSSESGSTPYPSSVVIVALTASRDEEDRVQALAAGCNDFLTKPVSTVWLHNKVTEWGSIKALQQWAPTDLPDTIRESQVQRAKRVASGLVPPTERRTPSPGHSKRIQPPQQQPEVTSPPPSAPSSGAMQSAASSSSWAEASPMTFSGNLGVPTPVTAGFSPRGGQASFGQSLNVIDEDSIHAEDVDDIGDIDAASELDHKDASDEVEGQDASGSPVHENINESAH